MESSSAKRYRGFLGNFPTEPGFTLESWYHQVVFVDGVGYPSFLRAGFSRAERDRRIAEDLNKPVPFDPLSLPFLTSGHCPLCRHLHRTDEERQEQFLTIDETFCIIPNRFPQQEGAALLLPKHHQPASGYTIARYETMLAVAQKVSQQLKVTVLRNHFNDGMSVPEHDHLHLWPNEVPAARHIQRLINSGNRRERYTYPTLTPFDTLAIHLGQEIKNVAVLLHNLDQAQIRFTFAIAGARIAITPRLGVSHEVLGVARPLLFQISATDQFDEVVGLLPRRGEFPWLSFIDGWKKRAA